MNDETEELAKFMFTFDSETYADPVMVELAWEDPNVRVFWIARATRILTFIQQQENAA